MKADNVRHMTLGPFDVHQRLEDNEAGFMKRLHVNAFRCNS